MGRANTHGLHYYSTDGRSWTRANGQAYNSTITFADGTGLGLACRERPHIVQDVHGAVIGLTNGAVHLLSHHGTFQLLPPAPPYYSFPRGKNHTRGNIWSFTVGWHECCDPTGGAGALCNVPCTPMHCPRSY